MYLPSYYEFCSRVKTVAGHDVLEDIPEMLAGLRASKPMIITDKGVSGAGLINIVTEAIKDRMEIRSIEDDVPPDSDLKVVNNLAKVYKEKKCDSLIAIGGGSVLDTAKGVNIVVSEDSDDLMQFTGAGALRRPLKPLIAVPTTSGTGSEVTLVAVIADHEKQIKMLFTSYFLLPDIAVLDSRMTLTLPPAITAATAMDALCHAVESYTCLSKNPLSDAHAVSAIKLISENMMKVVEHPDDKEGRLAVAVGANLAGAAFSNSMVAMVHSIGHSVGAICHVPHGNCMAILLPYGLEYNYHKNSHYTSDLLLPLAGEQVYATTPKHERARKAISYIRELNQQLYDATDGKHARFFKEVMNREGKPMVSENKLEEIAELTLGDGSIHYNPEDLNRSEALMVLQHAWEGMPLPQQQV